MPCVEVRVSSSWISADWPAPENVIAGTTLRHGKFEDLNLGGEPCWLEQVHGSNVVSAKAYEAPPVADASVSETETGICVVRTADCLPVLLCAMDGSVVAAAHAGWRGLAGGVIENAVLTMSVADNNILAWLGPAISQPSFEVGAEVKDAFVTHDSAAEACFVANARGRWQGDLYALARLRLHAIGISSIHGGEFCTYLDAQRFHSYRRDPECGRMVSFIALRTP
jgi:YfiH family protein